jgi:hypothetical protein
MPARIVKSSNATSCRLFPGVFGFLSIYIARLAASKVGHD